MSNLTAVTLVAGIPTAGDGTVSTLDNLISTAGASSTNVLSVQGIASGTTMSVTPIGLAQGATTSGQTGSLIMGAVTTAAPSYTTAQTSPVSLDTSGNQRVVLNAETTKVIGTVNVAASQTISAINAGTFVVQPQAATSGGVSFTSAIVPNNVTNVVVKSGAGQLYKVRASNNGATIAYIKIYDATSATAGSGTPVDRIMIPSSASGGAGIVDLTTTGAVFATGITYIVTTGIADADTVAPAASTYIITMFYK